MAAKLICAKKEQYSKDEEVTSLRLQLHELASQLHELRGRLPLPQQQLQQQSAESPSRSRRNNEAYLNRIIGRRTAPPLKHAFSLPTVAKLEPPPLPPRTYKPGLCGAASPPTNRSSNVNGFHFVASNFIGRLRRPVAPLPVQPRKIAPPPPSLPPKPPSAAQRLAQRSVASSVSSSMQCLSKKNSVDCEKAAKLPPAAQQEIPVLSVKGGVTEETVGEELKRLFEAGVFWHDIGSVYLFANPYDASTNSDDEAHPSSADKINQLVELLRSQFLDGNNVQAVIFSGEVGSGKSLLSQRLLRRLMALFGRSSHRGGPLGRNCSVMSTETCPPPPVLSSTPNSESRASKAQSGRVHEILSAAFALLSSFSCSATDLSPTSSQIACCFELHISRGRISRIRLNPFLSDMMLVTNANSGGKMRRNFNIFYEMLAGLNRDEKVKFHLASNDCLGGSLGYRYLTGFPADGAAELLSEDADSGISHTLELMKLRCAFAAFREALAFLEVPFSDIVRVLAAVLLLGNVKFEANADSKEAQLIDRTELDHVAALLGLTPQILQSALTSRSETVAGQCVKRTATADQARANCDCLARTLYARCLLAVVRRVNTVQSTCSADEKTNSAAGLVNANRADEKPSTTASSDDGSAYDSGIGLPPSTAFLNGDAATQLTVETAGAQSAGRSASSNGVISVVDWFGFRPAEERDKSYDFSQLCSDYAAEKVQQFYRDSIFEENRRLMRDEGLEELTNDAVTPAEHEFSGKLEKFVCQLNEECSTELPKDIESDKLGCASSGLKSDAPVQHFNGAFDYERSDVRKVNMNRLSADLLRMFDAKTCNFGFVSYLFHHDLEWVENNVSVAGEKATSTSHPTQKSEFEAKIVPICSSSLKRIDGGESLTLLEDIEVQSNRLFGAFRCFSAHKTFVHCLNTNCAREQFSLSKERVASQLVRLDSASTVSRASTVLPYRQTLKRFNAKYGFLTRRYRTDPLVDEPKSNNLGGVRDRTKLILDCYLRAVDDSDDMPYVPNHWALGREHIFLSLGAVGQLNCLHRRHVEAASSSSPNSSCSTSSSAAVVRLGRPHNRFLLNTTSVVAINGAAQPSARNRTAVSASPRVDPFDRNGRPPPIPPARQYTVAGRRRIFFPQRRVMVDEFRDVESQVELKVGEVVKVVGMPPSTQRQNGFLLVEQGQGKTVAVPSVATRLTVY